MSVGVGGCSPVAATTTITCGSDLGAGHAHSAGSSQGLDAVRDILLHGLGVRVRRSEALLAYAATAEEAA